ncbi:DUF1203 domain-containing protein [Streptosporangium sp. NPDC050855]|uniref:DUF1203 domain-containing protein n=1 Tax=Streptosporangium sp. NPDC050855 TaxID=3366194 RepID=UPI003794479D
MNHTETTRTRHRVRAIAPDVLRELLERDDAGGAPRMVLDEEGGNPMRCCLGRSLPGERIALVSYAPLRRWAAETGADPGPYDEVGPVFVHTGGCAGPVGSGFPDAMRGDRRALRAYAADGRILKGRYVEAGDGHPSIEEELDDLYRDPEVAAVHLRAVEFGCFLLETRRD